jgi:hypothetical protein
MAPKTRLCLGNFFSSLSPFLVSGGDFFSSNPNPMGISIPDIIKEFSLYPIPDPNPMRNPYLILNPDSTVVKPTSY